MARKKFKKTYKYKCTITGKTYTRTRRMDTTDELISTSAYYELNPEKDDRPEKVIKIEKINAEAEAEAKAEAEAEAEVKENE